MKKVIKKQAAAGRPTKKKITKPALKRASEIAGGVTNLALKIGVDQSCVSSWLYTHEKIPAHHVHKIVIATDGEIRPEELRPDVFVEMPGPKGQ